LRNPYKISTEGFRLCSTDAASNSLNTEETSEKQSSSKNSDSSKSEIDDMRSKILRLHADIDNIRKRHEKAINESVKFASEPLAIDLLSVYEDIGNCLSNNSETSGSRNNDENSKNYKNKFESLHQALTMIQKNFIKQIEKNDIFFFKPESGSIFDVEMHEGVGFDEIRNENNSQIQPEKGTISHVARCGIKIHEKIVKPALVRVYK
ncbi:MAG: hypothetical protein MHPSP_001544, partial [Paramarteilia canceri]